MDKLAQLPDYMYPDKRGAIRMMSPALSTSATPLGQGLFQRRHKAALNEMLAKELTAGFANHPRREILSALLQRRGEAGRRGG